MDSLFEDLFTQLGVAAPLVIFLFYQSRQSNEERREITRDFLVTLRETVSANTMALSQITAQIASQTVAIEGINTSFRSRAVLTSKEHQEIAESLDRVIFQMEIDSSRVLPAGTSPRNTPRSANINPPPVDNGGPTR